MDENLIEKNVEAEKMQPRHSKKMSITNEICLLAALNSVFI